MGKDFITVVLLSGDLFQWDGVGSITVEDFLVDVDADSGNAAPDMMSGKVVLYQYAADFLVVRPFDGDFIRPSAQLFLNGEGNDLWKDELPAGFQKRRVEYKAEKQVLAFFSFPGVAALAFTGSLELGSHGC